MSRTITIGSSLAQTKRETQIVERYRRFEAPERPDGGVSISHTDAEEILMHKTSEALERLRLWEENIFGETVTGADIFFSEEPNDYFSKRFKWYRGTTKNVEP